MLPQDSQALFVEGSPALVDNVSDWALQKFRDHYHNQRISKDDIWHYLYGVMHAPDWRNRYEVDLRKESPRIPLVPASAWVDYVVAGRELMALHIGYEDGPEYDLEIDCQTSLGGVRLSSKNQCSGPTRPPKRQSKSMITA